MALWPTAVRDFHFTIAATQADATQVHLKLACEPPELRGRSVLIVDDNAVNRRILTLQIQRWGMHAQSPGSPHEALEWLCQNVRFDLAILDLWMPEMDGIELARQIRELTQTAEEMTIGPSTIPLILLSSLGNVGKEIPPDLFAVSLNKPVRVSSLLDALMGIFSKQNVPEPTNAPLHLYVEKEKILPLRILVVDDYRW